MNKEIKVRIALAIDASGDWCANGYGGCEDTQMMELCVESVADGERRYFIEAIVALPEPAETVQGTVKEAS